MTVVIVVLLVVNILLVLRSTKHIKEARRDLERIRKTQQRLWRVLFHYTVDD